MRTLVLIFLALSLALRAQAPSGEAGRIGATLEALESIKSRLNEMQAEVDSLIRALSERKGALSAQPAPFGGVPQPASFADSPDKPKPVVRCAALTKDGLRCSRPAVAGARYCKQHGLARQK